MVYKPCQNFSSAWRIKAKSAIQNMKRTSYQVHLQNVIITISQVAPKVTLHKSSFIHKNHYIGKQVQQSVKSWCNNRSMFELSRTKETVDAMKYALFMQINRVHTLEQLQYCSRGPRSDVEGVSLFATCIHLSTYERERYNTSLPGLNYTTRTS